MPARPVPRSRGRDALQGALLAVPLWCVAWRLGLLATAGVPEAGWIVAAPVLGAAAGALGGLVPLWAIAATATLATLVVAYTPLIEQPARALVDRRDASLVSDAVMVLSSDLNDDGVLDAYGADRLVHGLALVRAVRAPVLVTSRVRTAAGRASDADQRRLAALAGLAPSAVLDSVASTHDEALRFAALARARGWTRVTLVTSPSHSRRACATFRRAGLVVRCAPSAGPEFAVEHLGAPRERLNAVRHLVYEEVAWFVYRQRGWV